CEGRDDDGRPLAILDRAAAELSVLAEAQPDDPTAFLANRSLFGDLAESARFRSAFLEARASLVEAGALATVAVFAGGST
ncbi:MAG: mannitol dehydrogenase family protein, partial [Nocardioidaceae bacterium]